VAVLIQATLARDACESMSGERTKGEQRPKIKEYQSKRIMLKRYLIQFPDLYVV
jgi:hypothetical protein